VVCARKFKALLDVYAMATINDPKNELGRWAARLTYEELVELGLVLDPDDTDLTQWRARIEALLSLNQPGGAADSGDRTEPLATYRATRSSALKWRTASRTTGFR
jgi:hypothetical protein